MLLILMSVSFNFAQASNIQNNKETILALGMEMSNMRNMLKAYILIGLKQKYKNPSKKLQEGIVGYEKLLETLNDNYSDLVMKESIQRSYDAWEHVHNAMKLALSGANLSEMRKGAIFIHGNIRTVIKELALMKKHLLDNSTIGDKKALDASIEIAASARRLSAHYMMKQWELNDPTIEKHWKKGLSIYGTSLDILETSPYMFNKKFSILWNKCKKHHTYFKKMWTKRKHYSILIDKKAEKVFLDAQEMTRIILNTAK